MKFPRAFASAILLAVSSLPAVHAIGDSGGCGDPLDAGGLGKALRTGSARDIEAAINERLDRRERHLTALEKLRLPPAGTEARLAWRSQQALNYIEGIHEKGAVCVPGNLLPVAVNAGNVEGTRYLLDRPFGVQPRIPERILFSCNHGSATNEQRLLRRQTYALVLDSGRIDINARLGERSRTALETCYDVTLLSLFVERGAGLDKESAMRFDVLDRAIESAVNGGDISFTVEKGAALERAQFFSERVTRSIRGRGVESAVRYRCRVVAPEKRRNQEACAALAKFIIATPGTFADP